MTLAEIRSAARKHLIDESFENFLDSFINEAYLEACEEIYPGLPGLDTITSTALKKGQSSISLPANSSGKVHSVIDSSKNPLTIVSDLEQLIGIYGNMTTSGDPTHVAVRGLTLHYAPIPDADFDVNIIHYLNPTTLSNESDVPSLIPEHLHRHILVYGAASIAFKEIELDSETEALAVNRYEAFFERGKSKFANWVETRRKLKQNTPQNV